MHLARYRNLLLTTTCRPVLLLRTSARADRIFHDTLREHLLHLRTIEWNARLTKEKAEKEERQRQRRRA